MYKTHHLSQRMTKRGITGKMINFTLKHGKIQGDKYVADKKFLRQHIKNLKIKIGRLQSLCKKFRQFTVAKLVLRKINQLQSEYSITAKLLDKGGIVVICENNTLITSYDVNSYLKY